MADLRTVLRFAAVPLTLLMIFTLFVAIYQLLGLPSSEELIQLARDYYSEYGYEIVFVAALVEGLLLVNWYLPGSFVIVLGVTFSAGRPLNSLFMVALVASGFFLTSLLNYAMGRYAWYRFLLFLGLSSPLEKVKLRVEKYGLPVIFTTYFHPNVGALTALSCGILRLSPLRFTAYSAAALIGWNSLWGVIVYLVGPALLNLLSMWMAIPLLVLWLIIVVVRSLRQSRRKEAARKVVYNKHNKEES